MFAIMIMDDGSLYKGKNGFYLYSCTNHGEEMNRYLSNKLFEKFGFKSEITQDKRKKECYFIRFNTKTSKDISKLVAKYIHPTLSYKIHEEYRNLCGTYKWDNSINSCGCLVLKSSEYLIEKEEVFDIEVEDNHNFLVTSNNRRRGKILDEGSNGGLIAHNCQDASEIMLEIFKKQKCKKIVVGDEHQQIYSWRNAVNSLDKVEGKIFKLTKSFRFEQNIADLAINVIKWKKDLYIDNTVGNFNILGCGVLGDIKTKAVIARTNLFLITYAIDNAVLRNKIKNPYFEGGFSGYSINSMYTPLNDFKNISKKRYSKIKMPKLKDIKSMVELEKFIEMTEDVLLSQALALYETYGDKLTTYISELKEVCVESKEDADYIFTTAHKSKGMEYDSVILLDDFKSKSDFSVMIAKSENKEVTKKLVNEEINLLYVAITRSKGVIKLPEKIESDIYH